MKARRLTYMTLLLAVTACSKTDLPESVPERSGAPIDIRPVAAVMTKSAIDSTVMPSDRTFTVCAAHNGRNGRVNYFTDITFTGNGLMWSSDKCWPDAGTLDLLAYSADGLTMTDVTYGSVTADGVTFTVSDNSSVQSDILYAAVRNEPYDASGVRMTFRHACALLAFTASSATPRDTEGNYGITIRKITVTGAKWSGTLSVDAATGDCSWSSLSGTGDVDVPGAGSYDVPVTPMNISLHGNRLGIGGSGLLVPAQAQTGFTVYYTMHAGRDAAGNAVDYEMKSTQFCAGSWLPGKKHVYNISFRPGETVVNPSVTDWEAGYAFASQSPVCATYGVSSATALTLPAAVLGADSEVCIDWGDGYVETVTDRTKAASISGRRLVLGHTYASAHTGNVTFRISDGYIKFKYVPEAECSRFSIIDSSRFRIIPADPNLVSGVFTVGDDGHKVCFTHGNLRALVNEDGTAVTEWKVSDNQYDVVGAASSNSDCRNGWVDLFGWTAAGLYSDGVKQYGINNSLYEADYNPGPAYTDVCDWGATLGKNYRPLDDAEWNWLASNGRLRNASSGVPSDAVIIAGVPCCVVIPDEWNGTVQDSYTADEWLAAEASGLVALPKSGFRSGHDINAVNGCGFYWTPQKKWLNTVMLTVATSGPGCCAGGAVRLVADDED